jgi:hypothetical protein
MKYKMGSKVIVVAYLKQLSLRGGRLLNSVAGI